MVGFDNLARHRAGACFFWQIARSGSGRRTGRFPYQSTQNWGYTGEIQRPQAQPETAEDFHNETRQFAEQ